MPEIAIRYKISNMFKKLFNKKTIFVFLILAIFVTVTHPYWVKRQCDKVRGTYFVYKGDKAYQSGKLQNAIDYYNMALELYPEHFEARCNLGNIYVAYEDYYAAEDCYRKSINYNPRYTMARMNLGIVYAEKTGNFDAAIDQYQHIINTERRIWEIPLIFSNKISSKVNKGLAYYNMGVAYREKAIYETGNNEDKRVEYLQMAVESYNKASEILKSDYDTFYNLGIAYHLLGNFQQAGNSYCKAIHIEPMNYEAHYNLAVLLRHLKLYKQAIGELEKANILVSNSNRNTSTYVFDVLNDVSHTMATTNQYKDLVETIGNEHDAYYSHSITYVHGKIVATEDLDKAMLKNFSTCGSNDFSQAAPEDYTYRSDY